MAKYSCELHGSFNHFCQFLKNELINSSFSASIEDEHYYHDGKVNFCFHILVVGGGDVRRGILRLHTEAHPVALRRAEGGRIRAGFRHGVAVLIHPDGAAGQQVGVRSLAVLIRFQHGCLLGRHAGEVVGEVIGLLGPALFQRRCRCQRVVVPFLALGAVVGRHGDDAFAVGGNFHFQLIQHHVGQLALL